MHEAMEVLDIIDAKTEALLSYISVSLAAMVFLLTGLQSYTQLRILFLSKEAATTILLLVIVALMIAIILCLSCLNIVGAHTIAALKSKEQGSKEKEYEDLIIRVTLGRRTRYLIAHRISIVTAVGLVLIFLFLILGSGGQG